ncbi:DEAD/DEAH box helicase [uncultured Subdoligranulum sp.]|uniref:DEAD/DEAH box helicase n=1 Tax=uncultured Subdoligranulum sp. TaxID=512298 RepID=UPI0025EC9A1F|nr:DEAD/DEAH box helicase [uncultured Subdoligranulum sp.]
MVVTLDGRLHLTDCPAPLRRKLMEQLTIPNPAYQRAAAMGLPTWDIPKELMLFQVDQNELILPRGMTMQVWRQRPKGTTRRDRMTLCAAPRWPPGSIRLRGYQQRTAQAVLQSKVPQGVIVMPCGAGKTETGLYIAQALGQPVLWIAHTVDLIRQVYDRAADRLGLTGGQLGMLAGGERRIGTHLTVATVQTLYHMEMDGLAPRFGTVIVDECQHVVANPANAEMYNAVLGCLPAYYRYGLTATPQRADGLADTIHMILGGTLATVSQQELVDAGGTVLPAIQPVQTAFRYAPGAREAEHIDHNRLRRHMTADAARTAMILNRLVPDLLAGHTCIALGSSLDMLARLEQALAADKRLQAAGILCRSINGSTRAVARAETLRELRAPESPVRCLLATYQLAKEGLDIPRADRLFLVQPVRDATAIQQAVGRIMRPAPGKTDALVYDFVDILVPTCKSQFSARKTVYRKLNAEIYPMQKEET